MVFVSRTHKDAKAFKRENWNGGMWRKAGTGRWWRRALAKSRRQSWRQGRERGQRRYESLCNWKLS